MKSINNIFEMVKADRYTADGREEIIKAQEAETQDTRRYKTGEISEATGLQKQPDGSWAPPKSTKYGKVITNKEGKVGIQQTLGKGSKFEEFANEKSASRALANLTAGYNTTERSKEDPHSDKARQVKHWDKETEQIKKENKAERRAAHAAQFQNEAGAPAEPKQEEIGKFYTKFDDAQGAYDAGRQTFPEGGYTIFKTPTGQYKVVDDPKTKQRMTEAGYQVEVDVPEGTKPPKSPAQKDSAPLTGDTRIRMNQVTDKVYQIGEISQKTGLQKTANGWVKPKKGAPAGTKKEDGTIHKKTAISKTTSEQLNQSDNLKEGKWVNFETTNGNRFTGKVTMIGKNLIKFRDAEGKEMGFNKKNITRVEPKTEESQNAPGPVGIPSNEALLSHLV